MNKADDLAHEVERLRIENAQLKSLLREHGISLPNADNEAAHEVQSAPTALVTKSDSMAAKTALFLSLFQGRNDVYAKRWESKNGRAGYSPACKNEWKQGVCLKPKGKCAACMHADYCAYDESAVQAHLRGDAVLGIYPLLLDDTCRFLAIDFDEESWKSDVKMVAQTCRENDIPCAIEISRSANGAHLWLFFDETIEAVKARTLGSAILTLCMQEHARLSFKSYDRMFPNQDTMPKGGFGNLIALPLQISAARHGGSLFVDDDLNIHADQWRYLSGLKKLNAEQVDKLIAQIHTPPLGTLREEDENCSVKPWQKQKRRFQANDIPQKVEITLADGIYIPMDGFSNRAQNQIKRLAAFRNPQFYRSQAMRMPVWNIPRVICCAEYRDNYMVLPLGCLDDVLSWMREMRVFTAINDERYNGRSIRVSFNGQLRDEQIPAFEALISHETAVLSATTAFGKTVIGAALIAKRQVNTLILVHRSQLMEQWQERLQQFLSVDERLVPLEKRAGRQKKAGDYRLLWRKPRYAKRNNRYRNVAVNGNGGRNQTVDSRLRHGNCRRMPSRAGG